MRAISRFARRRRVELSSAPVAAWKRRLNSSWRRSCSASSSWSSVMSRKSLAFKEIRLPLDDLRLDGQLVAGQPQGFLRERLGDARKLEHDAAGLHDRDPAFRRALALAHARLGRLLRERLVGEDVDPHLAAALDLAVRDPGGVERLQAEVAELHRVLALRMPAAPAAMLLAELRLLGK